MTISQLDEERKEYRNFINVKLKNSLADSQKLYLTNYWFIMFAVAAGLVLIGFSIADSIAQGASAATVTYAGLGILDFVALFLINPQKRLLTLLGDVGQIALIYKTWIQQSEMIDDAAYDKSKQAYRETDPDKVMPYINEYAKIREEALSAIENYVRNDPAHD